jgi:hypothetical protein
MTDRDIILKWMKETKEKKEILRGFVLIDRSIDFIQEKIDQKFVELDDALRYHKHAEVRKIRGQIFELVAKVGREDTHAKILLDKYAELCQDEKKELLPNTGEKK